ncbi:MAG: hypothetical protein GX974_10450, partial [Clostridiales bacterium]|nr:hypothetical protein [Clostridiales bacterium]
RKKLDISGDWDISIEKPNALRLAKWELQIEGSEMKPEVDCQPIINQVSDTSIPLPVKLKDYFGTPKEMQFPELQCRYKTRFKLDIKTPILLVMEPDSIEGEWQLEVNGNCISPEDFISKKVYMSTNLAVDITSYLNLGSNEILVNVYTRHVHDGLVNPLYLCGDFSVIKDSKIWKITSFNSKGQILDVINTGIPFYAGQIQYKKLISLDKQLIGDMLELYINEPSFQDTVKAYINGRYIGTCAWNPYSWKVDRSWLNEGENEIQLNISTTLIGLFEGQYFDYNKHSYVDI